MKRLLAVLVGLVAALAAVTAVPATSRASSPAPASAQATAQAPAPVTGRVVDFRTGRPARGVRILLVTGPGGTVIGSDWTNSEGRFSVVRTGAKPAGGFYVRIVGDEWVQSGIVSGDASPRSVEWSYAYARRYNDGATLGRINAHSAFVQGRVVDANTLAPVAGARVNLRRAHDNVRVGTALTGSRGYFRIRPIRGEDFNLQVNGLAVGHENGYRACNAQLVPTIGAACGSPIAYIGRVYSDAS